MLRLHLIPETPATGPAHGCAEIRLLRPWRHPWVTARAQVTTGPRLPSGRLDAVITQRAGPVATSLSDLQALVAELRLRRIPLLQDLDDDLLTEHPSAWVERGIAGLRPQVRFLLREADAVITSTQALAARVGRLNPRVLVWPNALDEALVLPLEDRPEGDIDLGYFGTLSHLEDLLTVVGPVGAALAGRPRRPRFELCGISEDARVAGLFAAQADVTLQPVQGDYARFMQAPQQAAPYRVGMAPLGDNAFNRSKSDIKFLDYALFGVPAVFADLPVYAAVRDGETGLKAAPADFGEAVGRLLEDAGLRERIRRNARDYLLEERVLGRCIGGLWDILHRVLDRAPAEAAA